jgi:uncharacterized membrane protein YfcA
MDADWLKTILLPVLVFVVACVYSSVGHGGASGYLAVLSFFSFSAKQMSTTALILNILVASIALYSYAKAGHLKLKLSLSFLLFSIPFAFIGGFIKVSSQVYFILLAIVLLFTSFRLAFISKETAQFEKTKEPKIIIVAIVSIAIGLLSGIVGVGGGIFLSPIMLLSNWADTKVTAATSSMFIVGNSIAGLLGRASVNEIASINFDSGLLIIFAFLGGIIGSRAGAKFLGQKTLCKLLAIVLIMAAIKLIILSLKPASS